MKILIAEDDLLTQHLMVKMLSGHGSCEGFPDGKKAIAAIVLAYESNAPYELLCIDVSMPEADGFEVLTALRAIEDKRNIPEDMRAKVLMVTGLDDPESFATALEQGSHWYVTKPIKRELLFEVLLDLGIAVARP